jgi:hypothetical protein
MKPYCEACISRRILAFSAVSNWASLNLSWLINSSALFRSAMMNRAIRCAPSAARARLLLDPGKPILNRCNPLRKISS